MKRESNFNENPLIFSIVRVQVPLSPEVRVFRSETSRFIELVFSFDQEKDRVFMQKTLKSTLLVNQIFFMVEPLLSGIVLGLVPVTIAGLFVTAYLQYRRGDQATW